MTEFRTAYLAAKMTEQRKVALYLDYVDINEGYLHDAVLFSQIMYWHIPSKKNNLSKMRVFYEDVYWVAKHHDAWYAECRIKAPMVRKALKRMQERNLIHYDVTGFAGKKTPLVRINWEGFQKAITAQYDTLYQSNMTQCIKPNTDITSTETTKDKDSQQQNAAAQSASDLDSGHEAIALEIRAANDAMRDVRDDCPTMQANDDEQPILMAAVIATLKNIIAHGSDEEYTLRHNPRVWARCEKSGWIVDGRVTEGAFELIAQYDSGHDDGQDSRKCAYCSNPHWSTIDNVQFRVRLCSDCLTELKYMVRGSGRNCPDCGNRMWHDGIEFVCDECCDKSDMSKCAGCKRYMCPHFRFTCKDCGREFPNEPQHHIEFNLCKECMGNHPEYRAPATVADLAARPALPVAENDDSFLGTRDDPVTPDGPDWARDAVGNADAMQVQPLTDKSKLGLSGIEVCIPHFKGHECQCGCDGTLGEYHIQLSDNRRVLYECFKRGVPEVKTPASCTDDLSEDECRVLAIAHIKNGIGKTNTSMINKTNEAAIARLAGLGLIEKKRKNSVKWTCTHDGNDRCRNATVSNDNVLFRAIVAQEDTIDRHNAKIAKNGAEPKKAKAKTNNKRVLDLATLERQNPELVDIATHLTYIWYECKYDETSESTRKWIYKVAKHYRGKSADLIDAVYKYSKDHYEHATIEVMVTKGRMEQVEKQLRGTVENSKYEPKEI